MLGATRGEEEDWLAFHTRTMRAAKEFVKTNSGHSYADQMLIQAAREWETWTARDGATRLRRLVAWQSAAWYQQNSTLIPGLGLEREPCRRRRRVRPPRRWETPMVLA